MADPALPLLDRTLELLNASPLPPPEIAKGAAVGIEWLKKVKDIEDPSVRRIQRLHDYLSTGIPQKAPSPKKMARRPSRSRRNGHGARA